MVTYKHLLTTIFMGVNLAYASDISYDIENITPQTWQEVNLSYVHKIHGKDYIEQAKLLRPTSWLEQYHLDKVGRLVRVNESDVGIDATVRVVAVKPNKLYFESQNYQSAHPVIGAFLKYSNDVWSYTFTNGETIEATSNHPFYDVEQQKYIPIGDIKLNRDHLLTDNGARVQLASKIKHNKGVEVVYNFEVYQAHNYYVSQNDISNGMLVHNPNGAGCGGESPRLDLNSKLDSRVMGTTSVKNYSELLQPSSLSNKRRISYSRWHYITNSEYRHVTDAVASVANRINRSSTMMLQDENALEYIYKPRYLSYSDEDVNTIQQELNIGSKAIITNSDYTYMIEHNLGNCGEQAYLCNSLLKEQGYNSKVASLNQNDHGVAVLFRNNEPWIIGDPWAGRVSFFRDAIKVYGNDFSFSR